MADRTEVEHGDERTSMYAALAFGGFMDADETERVTVWAAKHIERLETALDKPLRETILAVLRTMPSEAAPEHLAAMIESQVHAWQRTALDA